MIALFYVFTRYRPAVSVYIWCAVWCTLLSLVTSGNIIIGSGVLPSHYTAKNIHEFRVSGWIRSLAVPVMCWSQCGMRSFMVIRWFARYIAVICAKWEIQMCYHLKYVLWDYTYICVQVQLFNDKWLGYILIQFRSIHTDMIYIKSKLWK